MFAMSRLGEALGNEPSELDGEIQRLFRHAYAAGYYQGLCDPLEAPEPTPATADRVVSLKPAKTLSAAAVRKPAKKTPPRGAMRAQKATHVALNASRCSAVRATKAKDS